MYQQLRDDHVELAEIASELRQRTSVAVLADPAGLGQCRWRLARTLTRHLALEDVHVYGRLDADPRPDAVEIARRFKRDLGHLMTHFKAHMAEWTGDAVARDWPGYCRAVHILLVALSTRIDCEESKLYPLLASDPKTLAA